MLQAHTIHPAHGAKRRKKRVGRGNASGHGTTATRGTKGQRARTGGRSGLEHLGFRRILQRIPKRRGFQAIGRAQVAVPLYKLEKHAAEGMKITAERLVKWGLVKAGARAKIVGSGPFTKKVKVTGVPTSAGARAAIEKAGGMVV